MNKILAAQVAKNADYLANIKLFSFIIDYTYKSKNNELIFQFLFVITRKLLVKKGAC